MNRGGLANAVIGVVLLCGAAWMVFTGHVIARPPSLGTRENSPIDLAPEKWTPRGLLI